MATTINDFETNKNAVIFHYPHLSPYGPAYDGEKPSGCVVNFHGYYISASIWDKNFRVFCNAENFSIPFKTLREAKEFVINKANKKRNLFK